MLPEALATTERLAREWNLRIEGPLPGATNSLVLAAGHAVLRVPLQDEGNGGADLLRTFALYGGVAVLREDASSGAVLLPRLRPGTTLAEVGETEAVEAFADLVLQLRGAQGSGPKVAEYLGPTLAARPLPETLRAGLAEDAAGLARRLVETSPAPRLMHGDLHHFNVLRHGDAWVAIDPEGIVGDPAYECAAFLRNPVPDLALRPDLQRLLKRRIERLAARLGDPPERIWGWALVRTAQCVSWSDASPFHAPWTRVLAALDALAPVFGAFR